MNNQLTTTLLAKERIAYLSLEEQELLDEIWFYRERLAEIGVPENSYEKMMYPVYHNLLQKNKKRLASYTYARMYPAA